MSSFWPIASYAAPLGYRRKVCTGRCEANTTIEGVTTKARHDSYYCAEQNFIPTSSPMRRAIMRLRTSALVPFSLVVGAVACGGSGEVPTVPVVAGDPSTVSILDPLGDTFGIAGVTQW